ncbi:MAG: PAS domain S-box protein [Burkholderiales bacterium]|nr:PAS domain S-box protein [Burkholderiales bacterium]
MSPPLSPELSRSILQLLPEVLTVTDLSTGRYIEVNQAWTEVLGHAREATIGRTSFELGVWPDISERQALLDELRASGSVRGRVMRFCRRDGRLFDAVVSAALGWLESTQVLVMVVRDVTEERRLSSQAEESRLWLGLLINNAPVGILATGLEDGRIAQINQAALSMYGMTGEPADLLGKTGVELGFWRNPEERRQRLIATLGASGRAVAEHPLRGADGIDRWIRSHAVRVTQGGRDFVLSMLEDATARHAMESALSLSNERFTRAFTSSPAPTVIIDMAAGRYVDVNQAWTDFTGHRREEVIDRNVDQIGTIVDRRQRDALYARIAVGESVRNATGSYRKKDGSVAEVLASLESIDIGGQRLLLATFVDLTSLRTAQAQLAVREQEMLALIDSVPVAVASIDRQHVCRACNRSYAAIYGKEPADLIGLHLRSYIPDLYELSLDYFERAERGEIVRYERSHDRLQGRTLAATLIPKTDATGAADGWFAVFNDVTDDRQRSRLIEDERQRLSTILEAIPDVVAVIECESRRHLDVNPAWSRMFGYTRDEAVGRTSAELRLIEDEADRQRVAAAVAPDDGFADGIEVTYRRKDGRYFTGELHSTMRIDYLGRQAWIVSVRDVTRRRRDEARILAANSQLEARVTRRTSALQRANEELEAFSYTVSHDLRAPLRAIVGFSSLLKADHAGQIDEDGRRMLDMMQSAASRMAGQIDGLLELSRLSRGELLSVEVDLSALAQSVFDEIRDLAAPCRVTADIQPGMLARGDPQMLRSLLTNLIGNACKYAAHVAAPHMRIGRNDVGEIFVADNGVGFDARYAGRLFEVFQRLHRADQFEGIGIGLATAKRIVSRHGGSIRAEGLPGQGATFYFTLGA